MTNVLMVPTVLVGITLGRVLANRIGLRELVLDLIEYRFPACVEYSKICITIDIVTERVPDICLSRPFLALFSIILKRAWVRISFFRFPLAPLIFVGGMFRNFLYRVFGLLNGYVFVGSASKFAQCPRLFLMYFVTEGGFNL